MNMHSDFMKKRPIGEAVKHIAIEAGREGGLGSIPRPAKSEAVSSMACHRCNISLELCCSGAKPRTRDTLGRNSLPQV